MVRVRVRVTRLGSSISADRSAPNEWVRVRLGGMSG